MMVFFHTHCEGYFCDPGGKSLLQLLYPRVTSCNFRCGVMCVFERERTCPGMTVEACD